MKVYKRTIALLLSVVALMSVVSHPTAIAEDTATQATGDTITVTYDVNFPSGATNWYGNQFPASPTLLGTDVTNISDVVTDPNTTTARDVSDRMPIGTGATHNAKFHLAMYFTGWRTETGETVEPGTILTWADLNNYDNNGDGVANLTAQWTYGTSQTVNFCVRYDSKTNQSDTSTSKYTPSIYTTYISAANTSLHLDGTNDADAYSVDKQIRELYGNYGGDVWMYRFPSDAEVFESLKSYVSNLTVEDEAVNLDELNDTNYAIRWYMIKYDGGDGWHVDGRLIKKKGQIEVNKNFYGEDEEVLGIAQDSFYIVATNGTETNGVFTPYTSSDSNFKQHVLYINPNMQYVLRSKYPNATLQEYDTTKSNTSNNKFTWMIEDVLLNEKWQIIEYPVEVTGYSCYSEYSVYDTDGNVTALSEYGSTANVTGKIFALDGDASQGLKVDFRNYYYLENSIFIKKEDGKTGLSLSGATLELWQTSSNGAQVLLMFNYDNATGQYTYDMNGTISQLTLNKDNFVTISTAGFSYEYGDIVIKEVIAPTGYDAAPNVTVGSTDGTVSIEDISYPNGVAVDVSKWSTIAELEENGRILIIKNYSSTTTSLTVNKVWNGDVTADSVTIVLYANGSLATNVFPNLTNNQVTLNAAGGWTYTWNDLPSYANGSPVEWSVKEIKVGSDALLADGVSFANWTAIYSPAVTVDSNSDGIVDKWTYTITNTVRRTQLFITKTNLAGTKLLEGAEFTLVNVRWNGSAWTPVNGAITYTATSDANGLVHFDNLTAGLFYQLTEVTPPEGCSIAQASIVITLNGNGQVMEGINGYADNSTLDAEYHNYTGPYNINIKNILQYNWSVSAPDEMTFTYIGTTSTIWNPDTLQYETKTEGGWSKNDPIAVTNLSEISIQLTVIVEMIFTDGYDNFDGIIVEILASQSGFTVTRTDSYIMVTGNLAQNQTCEFVIQMTGTPPAATTESPVQIGGVSVKVSPPSGD